MPRIILILLSAAFFMLTFCTAPKKEKAASGELPVNDIEVSDAWARPAKQGMMGGAYMTIANGTDQPDTLVAISTNVASSAEIHESYEENGVSGMRPAGELPVEAQTFLQLKPGGYHVMMMQLQRALTQGDTITATLFFSQHDSITVKIPIRSNNP